MFLDFLGSGDNVLHIRFQHAALVALSDLERVSAFLVLGCIAGPAEVGALSY